MANRIPTVIWKAAAALVATIAVGACSGGTPHVRTITLTLVRHAQAENNADKVIDTDVPGPGLTHDGQGQAQQLAHQLARNGYDGCTPPPWSAHNRPPHRWPPSWASRSRSCPGCGRSTPAGMTASRSQWPTRRTCWRRKTG
ncbi:histidine phosphatase super family protein [Mycobacterium xenopi 3993]|nr:histidine phosphatase super family protein [Mycobacterium xenopi 3993]